MLTKFVVARPDGGWFHMGDEKSAREWFDLLAKHGRTGYRLERWVYPILPNGTHGAPAKYPA